MNRVNKGALKRLKAWLNEWERVHRDESRDSDEIHTMQGSFITAGKTFHLRASDIEALIEYAESIES